MTQSEIKRKLLLIWVKSASFKAELAQLSKIAGSAEQKRAIESVQNSFDFWRGCDFGKLMNLFGLGPEDRE